MSKAKSKTQQAQTQVHPSTIEAVGVVAIELARLDPDTAQLLCGLVEAVAEAEHSAGSIPSYQKVRAAVNDRLDVFLSDSLS